MKQFFYKTITIKALFIALATLAFTSSRSEEVTLSDELDPALIQPQEAPGTDIILPDEDVQLVETISPKAPEEAAQASITMSIPIIGEIALKPSKDAQGETTWHATFADSNKKIDLGPLVINEGEISLSGKKKVGLSAKATAFGKYAARLSLAAMDFGSPIASKEGKKAITIPINSAHLRLEFINKPQIPLLFGRAIELDHAEIILKKDKPLEMLAHITMFGKPTTLMFNVGKEAVSINFAIPVITFADVIKPLEGTPFANISLKDGTFTIKGGLGKNSLPTLNESSIEFSGIADFSSVGISGLGTLGNVHISASGNKKEGLQLVAGLKDFTLPVVGNIASAQLQLAVPLKKKTKPSLTITGEGSLDLPEIGAIPYTLNAGYTDKGFAIQGQVKQDVSYLGVQIKNATISLKPETKQLTLTGNAGVEGLDLLATLLIGQDPKEPTKKTINFSANVEEKTIKPFEKTGIPGLKDVTIENAKAGLQGAKGATTSANFFVTGTMKILESTIEGSAYFIKSTEGTGIIVKAAIPDTWRVTDAIPQLKGTFFDELAIKQGSLFACSLSSYVDPETNIKIKRGITLSATVPLKGALGPVGTLIGGALPDARIYGTLDPNPANIILGAELGTGIPLGTKMVQTGPLALEITGRPSIALLGSIIVTPSDKDEPLDFVGRLQVEPIEASASSSMVGMWKNPFGIKGFSFGNIGMQLGINYAQFAATRLPSKLGLIGSMSVAGKELTLGAQVDTSFKDMALLGKLNELSIYDIVSVFAAPMGANIPKDTLANLNIKDVEVKFAPHDVSIGEIVIPQGLTIKGELNILQKQAVLNFNVDSGGVTALGYMSPIEYQALKITASNPKDSPTGGPILKIALNTSEQAILISGLIQIAELFKLNNRLSIAKDGISFEFETKIVDKFNVLAKGQSSGSISNPEFAVLFDFKQDFTEFLLKQINEILGKAEVGLSTEVTNAISKLNEINKAIAQSDKDLNSAKNAVKNASNKLNEIDKALSKAQSGIDSAKRKVDSLQKDIDSTNRDIDKAKSSFFDSYKLVALGPKLAGLKTAKFAADQALNLAKKAVTGTMTSTKQAAKKALAVAQLSVDKIAKGAARASLIAARESTKGILTAAQKSGAVVLKGGKYVAQGVLGTFTINKAHFEGSLSEIKGGRLPHMSITVGILGKEHTVNVDYDFNDILNSAKSVAQKVLERLQA